MSDERTPLQAWWDRQVIRVAVAIMYLASDQTRARVILTVGRGLGQEPSDSIARRSNLWREPGR